MFQSGNVKACFVVIVSTCLFLIGCSTSGSNVRSVANDIDRTSANGVKLALVAPELQRSSQQDGELYTLHSSDSEVLAMAEEVARFYGFEISEQQDADFVLELRQSMPDGGACIGGVDAAELNLSYTLSLLTLGAFPATVVHCVVVLVDLYALDGDEKSLMGEFFSNAGQVEIYGGVNDTNQYRKNVSRLDERKAIEASIGTLLNEIIEAGAFL